jgi:hypothetical protein
MVLIIWTCCDTLTLRWSFNWYFSVTHEMSTEGFTYLLTDKIERGKGCHAEITAVDKITLQKSGLI